MRYLTAVAVAVTIALAGLVLQVANLPGEAPKPIQVVPVDARQLAYEAATATAAHVLKANGCSDRYAPIIARAAIDHGLEPRIVAGLIYVESSCKADSVSPKNAVGLMQINLTVWRVPRRRALDPEYNVNKGAEILAIYIHSHGLRDGLHRFNGLGDPSAIYSNRVIEAANAVQR